MLVALSGRSFLPALSTRCARWMLHCAMATALVSLVACSSGAIRSEKSDLPTSSDETENSKRARVRLELALNYFSEGKTSIALDEVKQSIAADATQYEAHSLRGLIYMRLNELSLAEDSFRQALALSPKAASVQHNYGLLLCQQGRMAAAGQMFNAALTNPAYQDPAKTWMVQGLCQAKAGQVAASENSLLNAYQIEPGNPVVAYNLGLQFYKRGELVQAQRYLVRLNSSGLANAESMWLGAKVAHGLGDARTLQVIGRGLRERFPNSKELLWLEQQSFNE